MPFCDGSMADSRVAKLASSVYFLFGPVLLSFVVVGDAVRPQYGFKWKGSRLEVRTSGCADASQIALCRADMRHPAVGSGAFRHGKTNSSM